MTAEPRTAEKSQSSQATKLNNSLVWKLAFSQVRRIIGVFLRMDLWLILLTFLALVYYGEWQGNQALLYRSEIVSTIEEQEDKTYSDGITTYGIAESPKGIPAPGALERVNIVPTGSLRSIASVSPFVENNPQKINENTLNFFHQKSPSYLVHLPLGGGNYLTVATDYSHVISLLFTAFIVLLLVQFFTVIGSINKSKRKISKTLRPLYELTVMAQSMSADISAPLTSTIDALDTITENHLDRRISISDERQELQGLASAINNMLDRLDASYQAQLRFVSDASHELRTPIAIIQGYAGLLERWGKDDPETLDEAISAIKSESEDMQKLVEQLLFLARSDNQSLVMQKEEIDLSGLMEEVAKETEMIHSDHKIISQIHPDIRVIGDPQLLKQGVRILVDNSIKYTPPEGVITIQLQPQQQELTISVTDTGIGMTEEEVSHVFERFWRADEARNRKSGGTGLGLAIAKWIVDSHHGYLEISSRKQLGTKVSIVLPKTETPEIPAS